MYRRGESHFEGGGGCSRLSLGFSGRGLGGSLLLYAGLGISYLAAIVDE